MPADEQEDMIDRYIDRGAMYVADDGVKAQCIVTDEDSSILEIKNIATYPAFQRKGYAKSLINFLIEKHNDRYVILQVHRRWSANIFCGKCGFVRSHCIKNFFIDYYNHAIYENNVQLRDMIYLRKSL